MARAAELAREVASLKERLATSTAKNASLEREASSLRAELTWTKGMASDLARDLKGAWERIRKLESLLNQTSRNSSKPPSSDPPSAPKRKRKKGSKRKQGGQPGHEGRSRDPAPPEDVDRFLDLLPSVCAGCGASGLHDHGLDPIRHQVWDLPPIRPFVTEYRLHALGCSACGKTTRADLPEGAPRGAFGPGVSAAIALLTGAYRLSVRNTRKLLAELFGLSISEGTIVRERMRTSTAIADPVWELGDAVARARFVNIDETSFAERSEKAWLWVVATDFGAYYRIADTRGSRIARELLGTDPPLTGADRYAGYAWIPNEKLQNCLSHITRDFRAMQGPDEDDPDPLGKELGDQLAALFSQWHRYRKGEIQRPTLIRRGERCRERIRELLLEGLSHPDFGGKCKKILETEPALYTFLYNEGVEPTNNRAERALRHAVIWRKTSFGTQSAAGSRYVARILTVVETLRAQGRSVLEYLTQAARSASRNAAAPSLLPVELRSTPHPG